MTLQQLCPRHAALLYRNVEDIPLRDVLSNNEYETNNSLKQKTQGHFRWQNSRHHTAFQLHYWLNNISE